MKMLGQFLANPRNATPTMRTIWLVAWMFEWGIVLAYSALITGILLLIFTNRPGSDIALVMGVSVTFIHTMGVFGVWFYSKKSIARAGQGSDNLPNLDGKDGVTP